ncbi:MAG: pimeloyl-ACP methyl ester esterase BioH [Gammaproteobacteria bacterium]|nr:pimeloyl-ACP methyl ester esterase BioH [Gammaproteobacteria bacterium]
MTIFFEQHGSGNDIVLIHGWGMNGHVWQPIIDVMARHYRVTVIDFPGHGRSRDYSGSYSLRTVAEQIAQVAPPQATWVGWSLGGIVSMEAALAWPDAVKGLVLVGTTPKFVQSTDWQDGMPPELLNSFSGDLSSNYKQTLTRFLSLQLGDDREFRQIAKVLRQQIFQYDAPDQKALLGGLKLLKESDLRARLIQITQPSLVVHGDRDRVVPEGAARYLADKIPDSGLQIFSGVGHIPFLAQPKKFMSHVDEFFQTRVMANV